MMQVKTFIMFLETIRSIFKTHIGAYFVIGVCASLIDISVFIFLHEFISLGAIICHSISIPLSAIFSFICNAYLNFKKTNLIFYRFISFLIIVAAGYLLGVIVILFVDSYLNFGGTIGKLFSLPLVFIVQFYLNSKISLRE